MIHRLDYGVQISCAGRISQIILTLYQKKDTITMSDLQICSLAYEGKTQLFQQILNENPQLAVKKDQSGRTALHWACSGGHHRIAEILINNYHVNIEEGDDSGWTPLIIAVSAGREEIVDLLLQCGADVNTTNSTGQCSLHYAASKNRETIVKKLIERKADVNVRDCVNSTPLHRSASKGNSTITKLLIESRATLNPQDTGGNSPLHAACEEGRSNDVKLLIDAGANPYLKNKDEQTPHDIAAKSVINLLS
ncbi:DgyrCDS4169 [Dimorphilus gyrociliatus]|uniref:DgyrCDS4169 n=1 Tax=Dimorphilus gyrociliatus TaxID=2664684 RepID=A0A7I8VKS0_9ANNE|nr:DgyrCDS4169 [Dimorphilus gyrociliatus]